MVNLSIVTVNLNDGVGLTKTIKSVINQSYTDFEYIIIDGNSTDKSFKIIEKYAKYLSHWVSEADNGIYHAMNKAIRAAKGEYCLFLNSGDWLVDNKVLEKVFSIKTDADIITGNVYFYDTSNEKIKWKVCSADQITAKTLFYGNIPHQATFIKRKLFETVGLYNEELKIASDWLFFLEAFLEKGATYKHIDEVITYFSMDGISCNPETKGLPRQEQMSILNERYPRFIADFEQLEQLEEQENAWYESKEFKVYRALERSGIIQAGVFCIRVKNYLKRTLQINSKE